MALLKKYVKFINKGKTDLEGNIFVNFLFIFVLGGISIIATELTQNVWILSLLYLIGFAAAIITARELRTLIEVRYIQKRAEAEDAFRKLTEDIE
jgi:hypothetical protein